MTEQEMNEVIEKYKDEDLFEWICEECEERGTYLELRSPIDYGVDSCPNCSTPVTCVG